MLNFDSLRKKIILILFLFFIPFMLLLEFYFIPSVEGKIINNKKNSLKIATEIAMGVFKNLNSRVIGHKMSLQEAQSLATSEVAELRYNDKEYFWIHGLDLKMIMHPIKPALDGTDISTLKDPQGVQIFSEMNQVIAKDGEGFVGYMWPRPGDKDPVEKMSYVKLYKDWGWVIGTGVYVDDLRGEISSFKLKTWGLFSLVLVLVLSYSLFYANKITKQISNISEDINSTGENIFSSISNLQNVGGSLSDSSSRNAAFLEETVASLDEITSMVKNNSENAKKAADLSEQATIFAKNGEQQMSQLLASMNEIQAYSKKIAEITGVIDDIAFQTNLLSLNAAVEAARAGEQGRGFAVVADAVRGLAQRTSVSAKDITALISDSVSAIENSVKIAEHSSSVLTQIASSVNDVSNLNSEIAVASGEQTAGVEQISRAMNELDQATQSNASGALSVNENTKDISTLVHKTYGLTDELNKVVNGAKKAA